VDIKKNKKIKFGKKNRRWRWWKYPKQTIWHVSRNGKNFAI